MAKTNNNFKNIWTWLRHSKLIHRRKYYTSEELYNLFLNENKLIMISIYSFVCNINKCETQWDEFHKLEMTRRNYLYIILRKGEIINKTI